MPGYDRPRPTKSLDTPWTIPTCPAPKARKPGRRAGFTDGVKTVALLGRVSGQPPTARGDLQPTQNLQPPWPGSGLKYHSPLRLMKSNKREPSMPYTKYGSTTSTTVTILGDRGSHDPVATSGYLCRNIQPSILPPLGILSLVSSPGYTHYNLPGCSSVHMLAQTYPSEASTHVNLSPSWKYLPPLSDILAPPNIYPDYRVPICFRLRTS